MIQYNIAIVLFYVIILALVSLIIYFNIISGKNYVKGLTVTVTDDKKQCKFSNLPTLNNNNKCKNGSYYIQTKDKNYYLLSTKSKYYLNVCKQLCGGSTTSTGNCSDEKNPAGFEACIQDLQPASGCKNSVTPLAQKDGVVYYADEVSLFFPCQN